MTEEQRRELVAAAIKAHVDLAKEVVELIQHATEKGRLKGIPSGELYAMMCGYFTLDEYLELIDVLKQAGKIEQRGQLLTSRKEAP